MFNNRVGLGVARNLNTVFSVSAHLLFMFFPKSRKENPKNCTVATAPVCPSATLNTEHPFVAVLLAHDGTLSHRPD